MCLLVSPIKSGYPLSTTEMAFFDVVAFFTSIPIHFLFSVIKELRPYNDFNLIIDT